MEPDSAKMPPAKPARKTENTEGNAANVSKAPTKQIPGDSSEEARPGPLGAFQNAYAHLSRPTTAAVRKIFEVLFSEQPKSNFGADSVLECLSKTIKCQEKCHKAHKALTTAMVSWGEDMSVFEAAQMTSDLVRLFQQMELLQNGHRKRLAAIKANLAAIAFREHKLQALRTKQREMETQAQRAACSHGSGAHETQIALDSIEASQNNEKVLELQLARVALSELHKAVSGYVAWVREPLELLEKAADSLERHLGEMAVDCEWLCSIDLALDGCAVKQQNKQLDFDLLDTSGGWDVQKDTCPKVKVMAPNQPQPKEPQEAPKSRIPDLRKPIQEFLQRLPLRKREAEVKKTSETEFEVVKEPGESAEVKFQKPQLSVTIPTVSNHNSSAHHLSTGLTIPMSMSPANQYSLGLVNTALTLPNQVPSGQSYMTLAQALSKKLILDKPDISGRHTVDRPVLSERQMNTEPPPGKFSPNPFLTRHDHIDYYKHPQARQLHLSELDQNVDPLYRPGSRNAARTPMWHDIRNLQQNVEGWGQSS